MDTIVTETHCSTVYVPLDADAKLVTKELCSAISKLQTAHLDWAVIVAGYFIQAKLRTTIQKIHLVCC